MRFSLAGGYAKAPARSGAPLSVHPSRADAWVWRLDHPAPGARGGATSATGTTGGQPDPATAAAALTACTRSAGPLLTARLAPGAVTVACVAARLGVPAPAIP